MNQTEVRIMGFEANVENLGGISKENEIRKRIDWE